MFLNVAEKPSVAREIANILGGNQKTCRTLASQYNPLYEFPYSLNGQPIQMRVTSIRGHLLGLDFEDRFQDWSAVQISNLFSAPLAQKVPQNNEDLVTNLRQCSEGVTVLVLWLDCDREGEAIAYEVISIVNRFARNLDIKRAHFSALTIQDIEYAMTHLGRPQLKLAQAVEARQEIDLRIGASFTRLLTMEMRKRLGWKQKLISYGPCQFPTFGFIVKRYLERTTFESEPFWYISMRYESGGNQADFLWERDRLYDLEATLVLYESCIESGPAIVQSVDKRDTSKSRPFPLATVALQKLAAKNLKFSADHTMKCAEALYQAGIISYPRTETDFFKETIDLKELIKEQTRDQNWGVYANRLLERDFTWPKTGKHDDNSHPPIHPVKTITRQDVDLDQWRLYELICRHFLASCSKDAQGHETEVKVSLGFEHFHAKALMIRAKNYLEVYPYQKWAESTLPDLTPGECFEPASVLMRDGKTEPPALLTEADLISLMDKAGIGTDATIHQHIKTVQEREYVVKTPQSYFMPTSLGLALYKAFQSILPKFTEPELRAEMEQGMKDIALGRKTKEEVVGRAIYEMQDLYLMTESFIEDIARVCKRVMAEEEAKATHCLACNSNGHLTKDCPRNQTVPNTSGGDAAQVCYKCREPGHYANHCPNNQPAQAAEGRTTRPNQCYKCGQQGHFANVCPQGGNGGGTGPTIGRKENKKGRGVSVKRLKKGAAKKR